MLLFLGAIAHSPLCANTARSVEGCQFWFASILPPQTPQKPCDTTRHAIRNNNHFRYPLSQCHSMQTLMCVVTCHDARLVWCVCVCLKCLRDKSHSTSFDRKTCLTLLKRLMVLKMGARKQCVSVMHVQA